MKHIYNFKIKYSWGIEAIETHLMSSIEAEEYTDLLLDEGHLVIVTRKSDI